MKITSPMGKEYEILPCPWCGKAPELRLNGHAPLWYDVACNSPTCPVEPQSKQYGRPGRAVAAWNGMGTAVWERGGGQVGEKA